MKPKHILVTDDEANMLRTLEFILEVGNYRVSLANNGYDALEKIIRAHKEGRAFDLLITDVRLPDLSALELLDLVNEENIDILVMAISGHGSKEMVIELMRRGCNDYLDKPIDDEELLDRISRLLGSSSRRRARATRVSST